MWMLYKIWKREVIKKKKKTKIARCREYLRYGEIIWRKEIAGKTENVGCFDFLGFSIVAKFMTFSKFKYLIKVTGSTEKSKSANAFGFEKECEKWIIYLKLDV